MKILNIFAVATSISLIAGCSSLKKESMYFADTLPTVETVTAAGGEQLYLDTLFNLNDFNKDGSARTFNEYDFSSESAPCTVMGENFTGVNIQKSQKFYEVEKGSKKFLFNCRSQAGSTYSKMRLYLIGSSADCIQRGNVSGSMNDFAKQLDRACNGHRISKDKPTETDVAYKNS